MTKFSDYSLGDNILKAIQDLNFLEPTEIQQKSIPLLLDNDVDLIALAHTGTGKTAAFGLPLLKKIDLTSKHTQALILSPTRELCLQITQELRNYAKYSAVSIVPVYGGSDVMAQIKEIRRGATIIVATPGRLKDMLRQKVVNLTQITNCILDEADEMLNMGFQQDVDAILSSASDDKRTWLFSATMSKDVESIAKKFMNNPKEILVGKKNAGNLSIVHESYVINGKDRFSALKRLVDSEPNIFGLIFCRTKLETQRVAEKLIEGGYNSASLHGDLNQNQRDLVMKAFRGQKIQMLVATDVAARGLDVDNISHVIHYQLPDEMEIYNHRSGRTGRAGKTGKSIILGTHRDRDKINSLARTLQTKIAIKELPGSDMICQNHIDSYLSKLKQVRIHSSIEKYTALAEEELREMDKETLIKKILSKEFTPFLDYYDEHTVSSTGSINGQSSDEAVRFFISLGERDGYTWQKLKDYLRDNLSIESEEIFHVDVTPYFSFFNTGAKYTDRIISTKLSPTSNGHAINIEVASKRTKGGGGNGSGNGSGKSKSRNRRDDFLNSRPKNKKRSADFEGRNNKDRDQNKKRKKNKVS